MILGGVIPKARVFSSGPRDSRASFLSPTIITLYQYVEWAVANSTKSRKLFLLFFQFLPQPLLALS